MKEKLVTISIIIVTLLIAGGIIYSKNFQSSTIENTQTEKIAKWIGEHSILYIQTGCIHCKEQEDLFGGNAKYLNIIDCFKEENRQECIDAGIEATPTWIINGQRHEGVQPIEKLKELTDYQD